MCAQCADFLLWLHPLSKHYSATPSWNPGICYGVDPSIVRTTDNIGHERKLIGLRGDLCQLLWEELSKPRRSFTQPGDTEWDEGRQAELWGNRGTTAGLKNVQEMFSKIKKFIGLPSIIKVGDRQCTEKLNVVAIPRILQARRGVGGLREGARPGLD